VLYLTVLLKDIILLVPSLHSGFQYRILWTRLGLLLSIPITFSSPHPTILTQHTFEVEWSHCKIIATQEHNVFNDLSASANHLILPQMDKYGLAPTARYSKIHARLLRDARIPPNQ
jgi:hypothetical protein